jgi:hypothetical protein
LRRRHDYKFQSFRGKGEESRSEKFKANPQNPSSPNGFAAQDGSRRYTSS